MARQRSVERHRGVVRAVARREGQARDGRQRQDTLCRRERHLVDAGRRQGRVDVRDGQPGDGEVHAIFGKGRRCGRVRADRIVHRVDGDVHDIGIAGRRA